MRASARAVIGCVVLMLAGIGSCQAQYVRLVPPDPTDFVGYLTWNAGKGGIAWEPGATTDDPGGPPVDESKDQEMKTQYTRHRQASQTSLLVPYEWPAPDEFVSAPLPKVVHLDPMREIVLQIFLSRYTAYGGFYDPCYFNSDQNGVVSLGGGADPLLGVEVFAGDERIAGDIQSKYVNWYQVDPKNPRRPVDPAGFASCTFVMHPEALTLAEGTIIKLRITHYAQTRGFQYGLAGDHASNIRLGAYSDEEWIYRDPEGKAGRARGVPTDQGDMEAEAGSDVPAGLPQLAGAAAGGIALVSLRRRRPGVRLLVVLLLVPAFAGCLSTSANPLGGGPDNRVDGDIKSTQIADPNGTLSSAGNGSIFGSIYDDLGFPLDKVHVSILGTVLFTTSDERGRFAFESLAAATYRLRFDKVEFKSFEAEIEVQKGFVNRPEITMYPLVQKAAGDRAHLHDYWGGETSRVVMDVDLGAPCSGTGGSSCYETTTFRLPPPEDEVSYNTILPGTQMIEITVTWDSEAMKRQRIGLQVQNNADPLGTWNWTFLHPRASGEPFRYASAWELTDRGHQRVSSWNFQITQPPEAYSGPRTEPIKGFHVRMVIHKGAMPVEPAHPDAWMGKTSLEVMRAPYTQYRSPTSLSWPLALACEGQRLAAGSKCYNNWMHFGAPHSPIPADVKRLELKLSQAAPTTPDVQWSVRYLSAAEAMHYDYSKYSEAPAGTRSGLVTTWLIEPTPAQADPMYATKSKWYFLVAPTDQGQGNLEAGNPASPAQSFTLSVVAHKE